MSYLGFIRKTFRGMLNEAAYRRSLKKPVHKLYGFSLPQSLRNDYVISSNTGLFVMNNDGFRQVSSLDVFGLSVCSDFVYAAVTHAQDSVILKGKRAALHDTASRFDWQEIYRVAQAGHSGRIHQIHAFQDDLWITDTKRNLLTKVDRYTGKWKVSIGPFVCSYGHPILQDHNHVNGVFPTGSYLIFSAFRINKRSALCLCGEGKVMVFAHRNMGVHDCILSGRDFWFSDSYRMFDENVTGGIAFKNGKEVDESYFNANPAHFVRGIAGDDEEVIIGNSYSGSREERFKGKGNIFVLRNEKVMAATEFPGAQVYDILRLSDGQHFEQPPSAQTFREAKDLMTEYLGPAVETHNLRDLLVSQSGVKKFSQSDLGDITEYL